MIRWWFKKTNGNYELRLKSSAEIDTTSPVYYESGYHPFFIEIYNLNYFYQFWWNGPDTLGRDISGSRVNHISYQVGSTRNIALSNPVKTLVIYSHNYTGSQIKLKINQKLVEQVTTSGTSRDFEIDYDETSNTFNFQIPTSTPKTM